MNAWDIDGRYDGGNYFTQIDPDYEYNWMVSSGIAIDNKFQEGTFASRATKFAIVSSAIVLTAIVAVEVVTTIAATQAPQLVEQGKVVIGQSMDKVTEAANELGAEYYQGMPNYIEGMDGAGMLHNALWLGDKMDKGYIIIDIGRDITKSAPSIYHQMEQSMVQGYEHYLQLY